MCVNGRRGVREVGRGRWKEARRCTEPERSQLCAEGIIRGGTNTLMFALVSSHHPHLVHDSSNNLLLAPLCWLCKINHV